MAADQRLDLVPDPLTETGLNRVPTPCQRQMAGPPGSLDSQTPIPALWPTDRRLATFQQSGNLCLAKFGFPQDVNLVSFLSSKLGSLAVLVLPGGAKSRDTTEARPLPDPAVWHLQIEFKSCIKSCK